MKAAGYSGTPLERKLGLKDGQKVAFVALPDDLGGLTRVCSFGETMILSPERLAEIGSGLDVIMFFTKARSVLESQAGRLRTAIRPDGMVWICWPKKASKVATDMTEDVVREVLLPGGLVDVKVCAVDEVWSGLKLVIRKELR